MPYLGVGVSSTLHNNLIEPGNPSSFRQRGSTVAASVYIFPSVQRKLSDRLFIDLALPIYLGNVSSTIIRSEDPSLPNGINPMEISASDFFSFLQFGLRFGFGIRL